MRLRLSIYLGIHSLLIGLFPFFIPVYLWKQGFGLDQISLMISVSALGYLLGLWLWDRVHKFVPFAVMIGVSFLFELFLFFPLLFLDTAGFLVFFAVVYGFYNAFFWTSQRALFLESTTQSNSGRSFGDVQILVFIMLKLGIFLGGFLLEAGALKSVIQFSVFLVALSVVVFFVDRKTLQLPPVLMNAEPLSWNKILRFNDQYGSVKVFLLDGPFLFLESFFWTLSLYFLGGESFYNLGLIVIALAVAFGLFYVFIKNNIDSLSPQKTFRWGVVGYSLSWFLRAFVDASLSLEWLTVLLLSIAFFTSFFRLAFNKRFFDLAHNTQGHHYLFLKSYYSQSAIAMVFLALGVVFMLGGAGITQLPALYAFAGCMSFGYLWYRLG